VRDDISHQIVCGGFAICFCPAAKDISVRCEKVKHGGFGKSGIICMWCCRLRLEVKITESFQLEGIFKGHLVELPCKEQAHPQLYQVLRTQSSLDLSASRDGASNTPLGNLCHPSGQ